MENTQISLIARRIKFGKKGKQMATIELYENVVDLIGLFRNTSSEEESNRRAFDPDYTPLLKGLD